MGGCESIGRKNENLDVGGCESNGRTETWMWVDVKVLGKKELECGWIWADVKVLGRQKLGCG